MVDGDGLPSWTAGSGESSLLGSRDVLPEVGSQMVAGDDVHDRSAQSAVQQVDFDCRPDRPLSRC